MADTYRILTDCGSEALSWDRPGYEQTIGWWEDGHIIVRYGYLKHLVDQANGAERRYGLDDGAEWSAAKRPEDE